MFHSDLTDIHGFVNYAQIRLKHEKHVKSDTIQVHFLDINVMVKVFVSVSVSNRDIYIN